MNAIPSPPEYTKEIAGYDGFYRIGKDGSVWSCRGLGHKCGAIRGWFRMKPLRHRIGKSYVRNGIRLHKNGIAKGFKIHTLVAEAFIGRRPDGMECRHLDGNAENNNFRNLAWGTHQQNIDDRNSHGTSNQGERQGSHKLTEKDVLEIRRIYCGHGVRLAQRYGVKKATIFAVVARRTWKHI